MYQSLRKTLSVCFFFLLSWLSVQVFLPLFLPFFLGALLATAADPMVSFLSRRIPRPLGSAIGITGALCFLILALVIALALTVREVSLLAAMLPDLEQTAQSGMKTLSL